MKFVDPSYVYKQATGLQGWVVAEETEKILMRTSQDEDQKDVI